MMVPALLLLLSAAFGADANVDVTVDIHNFPDGIWKISPYLASMSLVYAWAPDQVYGKSNTTMSDWSKSNGLATARYPAGMASYWNWEDPSGVMGESTLDPEFDDSLRAPAEDWMSLDEYLDLCEDAGLTPLIGVNYNCHNEYWVPLDESIDRAVRQVEHVVSRGFTGALWYVGNEDGAQNHADLIAEHALAMKAVDPTMKVFWNDNDQNPSRLKSFLSTAGDAVDGAEFHGKWPYGGQPGLAAGTYEEWLQEVPLVERKSGQTWREKIAGLRAAAEEAGRPELLLANNEYGLGKPNSLSGFNRFTKSMVAVELAMEMYVAGYDVAAFWDNGDGGDGGHEDHMLLSSREGYRFNPMHIGFELLAQAAGTNMLDLATSFSNPNVHVERVHGFAAAAGQVLRVFLINKMESSQAVRVKMPSGAEDLDWVVCMTDSDDHWGTRNTSIPVSCASFETGVRYCDVELPGISFAMMRNHVNTH